MRDTEATGRILQLFAGEEKSLRLNEICNALAIKSDSQDYQTIKKTLADLTNNDVLVKSKRRKYYLKEYEETSTLRGAIKFVDDRAFCETLSKKYPRVYVKKRRLKTAFHGDTVKIKLLAGIKNKKPQGEVIEIISRSEATITGKVEFDGNFFFLVPDEKKYWIDFLIPAKHLNGAKNGDKVGAKFLAWKDSLKSPQAKVVEVIGEAGRPAVEFDSIMKEFKLPKEFPDNVEKETAGIDPKISPAIIRKRKDLRKETIFTIDPQDAKDFDDALSIEVLDNGNYKLGVHIADVSNYVKENSALDAEAFNRGTSVYLADRVVPMIPERLSNEICSLKPHRLRLAYSIFMEFTPSANFKNYEIAESVIKSKKRFSYSQVQSIIETGKGPLAETVLTVDKLAKALRSRRFQTGGIDFQTREIKFVLDENKRPIKAVVKEQNEAMQLVEECMLAANRTVAAHVRRLSEQYSTEEMLPFIYRVHDEPDPAKLQDLVNLTRVFGYNFKFKNKNSRAINKALESISDPSHKHIISQVLLRTMAKAEYSPDNIGHYGLGFPEYAHFTSPIRRYPDLIVHRTLKEYNAGTPSKGRRNKLDSFFEDAADQSTIRERAAVEAERASVKLAQTILADDYLEKEFDGTVSGVTGFGVFVTLDEIYAEGLLHIKDMTDDYYFYDEKSFTLVGKRKKKIFRFGKRIRVKIIHVNVEKRRIDLAFVKDVDD